MYLNIFAHGSAPLDMTGTDEFRSLLASAGDLGIPHAPDVPYRSCNIVLRRQRFHFLEWGDRDAPPIVLLHGGHQSADRVVDTGDRCADLRRHAPSAGRGGEAVRRGLHVRHRRLQVVDLRLPLGTSAQAGQAGLNAACGGLHRG